MTNTSCENCIFAKIGDNECLFDIPNSIKHNKNIYKKNNFNYIENYMCRYALSESVYNELLNDNLNQQQIVEYIISKLKIKYYLVVNLDQDSHKLAELCQLINNLYVKPKFISFINKNLNDGNGMLDIIQQNLANDIDWKLHNFITDIDLQQCMTICMDTNFSKTSAHLFCVYDQNINGNNYTLLNSRIVFLHMTMIVEQTTCQAIINNINNLDGLAMSFNAYKFLISTRSKNILDAIVKEHEHKPSFKYISYDIRS
jgi:hypothetical protein